MVDFISLGKIDKRYIYIILSFILLGIILSTIYNFGNINEKAELMNSFVIYIGLAFCFILELIKKRSSSVKIKFEKNYNINQFKFQEIIVVGITVSLFLMYMILDLLIKRLNIESKSTITNNNYAFGFLMLFIISIFLFKYNYYKHQFISLIIIILLGLIRYFFIIINKTRKEYRIKLDDFMIVFSISFLQNMCLSFYFIYTKLLIEKYYFSPYKVSYLIGIINGIITLIIYLIISYLPIENDNSLQLIEYNDKYYIDNIRSAFTNYEFAQIFLYIIYHIIYSFIFIIFNIIIQNFTLGHIFLPNQIFALFFIFSEVIKKDNNINLVARIIIIISFIFEIFISCVFLELIELNFCGLNKNIKKNIVVRAIEDSNESLSPNENTFEVDNQYIVHYDDDKEEIEDNNIKLEMKKTS